MLTKETKICEIKELFRGSKESIAENAKDIAILATRYGRRRGSSGFEHGISYIRALDCFFYMILSKEELELYASQIRKRSYDTVVRNVKMYINYTNDEKKGLTLKNIEVVIGMIKNITTLGQLQNLFNGKEMFERIENVEEKKERENRIFEIIGQLCTPPLDRYLAKNGFSWCREERQIALFFYNLLMQMKNGKENYPDRIKESIIKIFSCTKIGEIKIIDVYYEAAILRDYFFDLSKEDKNEFNKKLLDFCFIGDKSSGKQKGINELLEKYGKGKNLCPKGKCTRPSTIIDDSIFWGDNDKKRVVKERVKFAGWIMNAKPDIIVTYRCGNERQKYAMTLECKYESDAGMYKDYDGKETINQELLQEIIMTFLFGKKKSRTNQESPLMDYCKNRDDMWYKKYSFCDSILCDTNCRGLFNENVDDENNIINMGVKEVNFKDTKDYTISANDLIDYVYFGGRV